MLKKTEPIGTCIRSLYLIGLFFFGSLPALPIQDNPPTPEQVARLVALIRGELNEKYIYEETAVKISRVLEKRTEAYCLCRTPADLARTIEIDLFEASGDQHLHFIHRPSHEAENSVHSASEDSGAERFGLYRPQHMTKSIGYMKISRMAIEREAAYLAAHYMEEMAGKKTIIIDLRENQGGAAGMVVFLSSFFFPKPVLLYTQFNRLRNEHKAVWTLSDLPGKRPPTDTELIILISRKTFSAAEGFAYCLKHLGRAIIVGEQSAGGAHPIIWVKLPWNYELAIPFSRIIHPVSGTDWEGTGVIPHHKVPAKEALKKALELADGTY